MLHSLFVFLLPLQIFSDWCWVIWWWSSDVVSSCLLLWVLFIHQLYSLKVSIKHGTTLGHIFQTFSPNSLLGNGSCHMAMWPLGSPFLLGTLLCSPMLPSELVDLLLWALGMPVSCFPTAPVGRSHEAALKAYLSCTEIPYLKQSQKENTNKTQKKKNAIKNNQHGIEYLEHEAQFYTCRGWICGLSSSPHCVHFSSSFLLI